MKRFLDLTHKIRVVEDNRIVDWTIEAMLEEINRDHSDEFTDYDENDYLEGWAEWVEHAGFYKLVDDFEYVTVERFNEIYSLSGSNLLPTDDLETAGDKIDKFVWTNNYQSGDMEDVIKFLDEQENVGFIDYSTYFIYEIGLAVTIHN